MLKTLSYNITVDLYNLRYGIVVCSTTIVSGGEKHFEATNSGQLVAYQNGVQIAINLPTTITMSDVADYWKRH